MSLWCPGVREASKSRVPPHLGLKGWLEQRLCGNTGAWLRELRGRCEHSGRILKGRLQEKVNWPGVSRSSLMEPGLSAEPACGAQGLCQSAGWGLTLQGVGRMGRAGVPPPPQRAAHLPADWGAWALVMELIQQNRPHNLPYCVSSHTPALPPAAPIGLGSV